MPMRSAPRSSEGPAVVTMDAPISLAMMVASVVLPSPGGPESRTWSSGSPRWRAASTETRRLSTAARCPTYSSRRWGRSCRSTWLSSANAIRLVTRASSVMSATGGAAVDLVEQFLGRGDAGTAREGRGDELGRLARAVAELLDEDLEHEVPGPVVLAPRRGGHRGLVRRRAFGVRQRELRHLALELRDDVLGLLGADAGQAPEIGLVLARDRRGDLGHRHCE